MSARKDHELSVLQHIRPPPTAPPSPRWQRRHGRRGQGCLWPGTRSRQRVAPVRQMVWLGALLEEAGSQSHQLTLNCALIIDTAATS
eukprot:scaffold2413_cov45-Prasinocladus_malaysianus.AAC.1